MKTTKKAFIAVSMIGFAAMMFSCAGTNKSATVTQEATSAVQEQLDNAETQPETSSETPAEENLSEQNALQNENPSGQEEVPQNNDVSVPAAE